MNWGGDAGGAAAVATNLVFSQNFRLTLGGESTEGGETLRLESHPLVLQKKEFAVLSNSLRPEEEPEGQALGNQSPLSSACPANKQD